MPWTALSGSPPSPTPSTNGSMPVTTQCTNPPAFRSRTTSANEVASSGVPVQVSGGDSDYPRHVKRSGISAPSSNETLVSMNTSLDPGDAWTTGALGVVVVCSARGGGSSRPSLDEQASAPRPSPVARRSARRRRRRIPAQCGPPTPYPRGTPMDAKPRNLRAMLSEAKDLSELMVDLAYAALYFGDPDMAEEIDELEDQMSDP